MHVFKTVVIIINVVVLATANIGPDVFADIVFSLSRITAQSPDSI